MDSAASTLSFPGSAEDDGSLSVAAGLAKEAAAYFQSGKVLDCLRILNQLGLKKPDDPKVLHNIIIAEEFQEGCNDPKRLIEALENIKKRREKLTHSSGEYLEVPPNNGSNRTGAVVGSNDMAHQYISSSRVYNDEFDLSVIMFNIAVVWFHLHENAKAFSYLDTLYQNIEPVDELTAVRICLLLLDVALLSDQASRASDVISYMERVFCGNTSTNQVDNGASTQQQSSMMSKSALLSSNSTATETSNSDSVMTANIMENSLTRTLSEEESLEDESLQLLSSLDVSGQKRQRQPNDLQRSQVEDSLSATDLRLKLHLYKVRLMILTRNLKGAKREVKLAMNMARGKDYPMALYLKSQLEYARGNYRKAIKLLMASGSHTDTGISSMYYNNLGCIYYQFGKHHTSGAFFARALSNSSIMRKEKPRNLQTISEDKSLMITYNCGIHSLACGKPFNAALCFQTASQMFNKKPLLWLRIAECCIMAFEKGLIKPISSRPDTDNIRVAVAGSGKWRNLVLSGGSMPNGQSEYDQGGGRKPNLSMSLARQYLVNALILLDSSKGKYSIYDSSPVLEESESNHKNIAPGSNQFNPNGEVKDQKGGNSQSANSVADYESICMREKQMMKQVILADLAYVELALGNPLKALTTARSLLKLPDCSKIYIFLGTMYAAEALCLLNRPNEASEQLMSYLPDGDHAALPYSQEDCEKWTAVKVVENEEPNATLSAPEQSSGSTFARPEEARGTLYANIAANFALLGDLVQAHQFVTKSLADVPNSPQAILTAVYVDLKRGEVQEALVKLRHYSGVRFLPGSVPLKSSS